MLGVNITFRVVAYSICCSRILIFTKLGYKTIKHIRENKKKKALKVKQPKTVNIKQSPESMMSEPNRPGPLDLRPDTAELQPPLREEDMFSVSRKTGATRVKSNKVKPKGSYLSRPKSKLVNLTGGHKASVPNEAESYKL